MAPVLARIHTRDKVAHPAPWLSLARAHGGRGHSHNEERDAHAAKPAAAAAHGTDEHGHDGHGHSHAHGHVHRGPPAADAASKSKEGMRITWIGVAANVTLAGGKAAAGIFGHSSAMVADALHSVSDLVSDFITLLALKYAHYPEDSNHPYGHGRFETVGSLFVSLALGATGIGVAYHGVENYLTNPTEIPTHLAVGAAVVSVAAKEVLFRVTKQVGEKTGSNVVIANAWHHRGDAYSSMAALAGIVAAQLGYPIGDPIASVVVGMMILKAGGDLGRDVLRELTEEASKDGLDQKVTETLRRVEGVQKVHLVRSRRMGPYSLVDAQIQVDANLTVTGGHLVAEKAKIAVSREHPSVHHTMVHVEVEDPTTEHPEAFESLPTPGKVENDVRGVVKGLTDVLDVSHITVHYRGKEANVDIEIVLNPDLTLRQGSEIARNVRTQILKGVPSVSDVDVHLEVDDGGATDRPLPGAANAAGKSSTAK